MGLFERLAPPNPGDSRTLGADFLAFLQLHGEGELTRAEIVSIFQMDVDDEADLDTIMAALPANVNSRTTWWKKWDMSLMALEQSVWRGEAQALNFVADTSTHALFIAGRQIDAGPATDQTALANQFIAAIDAEVWDHSQIPTYAVIAGSELHVYNTGNNFSAVSNMTINAHGLVRYYSRAQVRTFLGL